MLLNRSGGVVWALKPPVGFVHKTTYALMLYMYGPVRNAFDAARGRVNHRCINSFSTPPQ
jgi:hypothetical protein